MPDETDINDLEEEIDQLKFRRETEVLSAADERELIEQIEAKRAQLQDLTSDDDDGAPIAPGQTVHIHYRGDPMLVTRAGTSRKYGAWDAEDGEPIGEAWSISETAVRGLMRRYDWMKVDGEALASVRGERDE